MNSGRFDVLVQTLTRSGGRQARGALAALALPPLVAQAKRSTPTGI